VTGPRLTTVLLAAEVVSAVDTVGAAILEGLTDWPRTWTPDERTFAYAMLLNVAAGLLLGRAVRRRRAQP
jgi:hypothetical protein